MTMTTLRAALVGGALALAASLAGATVLDFDNIGVDGTVPVAYGGLDWSSAGWIAFGVDDAPYTAHSGSWRVATDFGASDAASVVRFNAPTVFEGAWFAGWDVARGGATVSFQLFNGGRLVATSSALDPSATPAFLASGYAGLVDAVQVSSAGHGGFVMDDFQFTAAVPEPQTVLLMALGLVAVAGAARRRVG